MARMVTIVNRLRTVATALAVSGLGRVRSWLDGLGRVSLYTLAIVVLAIGQVIGYGLLQANARGDRQRDIANRVVLCEQRNVEDARRARSSGVGRDFLASLADNLRTDGATTSAAGIDEALAAARSDPPPEPVDCDQLRR